MLIGFSHPDAAIVLTCLSYYYGGLSDQQIHASFEALLQSDCAMEEYARWVKDAPGLPVAFRVVSGVNLSNVEQCRRDVFGPLRSAKSIIDFYMANIVFPKEMKEFPNKLSSSGWDIAQEKAHPTTGFSGTNDSRYILPLSIAQCELLPQLPTNAKVLGCLLRPENSFVDIRQISDTGVLDAESLVQMALSLEHPVRVILDVGAQVLELQNEEMVRKWLFLVPDSTAQAAIFFDRHNELCVLSRDGTVELFLTSPFAKQMDKCIVFLGGANLIGTHLDLPEDSMAIVTLGPGLTKDRLMQACWRLRKLGKGQSVVFCGSVEVQRKILESSGKIGGTIDVADVLKWCIANTGPQARKCIPLWATQGVRHQRRHVVSRNVEGGFREQRATSILEVEALSLQQRYGSEGAQREEQILLQNTMEKSLVGRDKQLADIRAKC
ncbi:hypothetical protein VE00_09962 [Pseudogymnoascus sp. WSF 3629]|nr:hypothetical protein VE00_09962 [Pseudogymnoascus sp. WSF 3629]